MSKANKKLLAVDIAECAIFVALMTATAFISIPIPFMPLTFQTVVSVLSGLLLGWKKGVLSMAVYCFMGLIGIPVFTAGGGILYVLKPSFGYIFGFILASAVAGLTAGKSGLSPWRYIVGAIAAFLTDYLIGVPYCMVCAHLLKLENLLNLLIMSNLIFMPKDAILSVLAGILAWRVLPVIKRYKSVQPKENKANPEV